MRSRQTILSPLLRSLAAFALVVFVMAQALCFVHCHYGGGRGDSAQPSCHSSPQHSASHDGDDDSAPSASMPMTACSTLKTMLAGGDASPLVAPQLDALYLLAPMTLALAATEVQPKAAFSRQVRTRDLPFTPEVCLGPAFRSLAPPFVG